MNKDGGAAFKDRLEKFISNLSARSENAYCDMISIARQDECLGWEIKVEYNKFGRKELDAHCKSAEMLGRHRALIEVCRELNTMLAEDTAHEKEDK